MSFRSFEITVGKKGVSPSVIHNAGVRSEHNATELKFVLDSDAQSSLNGEQGNGKTLYYRFDAYDGTGNKCSTEPKQVTSLSQSFLFTLENWLTKNGINIKVCLVLTAVKNNETAVEVFSGEVELQLKNISEGEDISGENEESISSLCIATKEAAMRAEKAEQSAAASEEACNEAKEKTLEARLALEEGAVWIFDGGTAVVKVDEQRMIDGAMSDTSTNAVQNKVAKKYVDDEISSHKHDVLDFSGTLPISKGGTNATTVEEARKNLGIAAIISEMNLGTISGGAVHHKINLDNGLVCVVGREQVTPTFDSPLSDNLKMYTSNVDMTWVDGMPASLHQVLVSVYMNSRPIWVQVQSYDFANKKFSVRLISTSNTNEPKPYVHYMIIGK